MKYICSGSLTDCSVDGSRECDHSVYHTNTSECACDQIPYSCVAYDRDRDRNKIDETICIFISNISQFGNIFRFNHIKTHILCIPVITVRNNV